MEWLSCLFPERSVIVLKYRDGSEIRGSVLGVSQAGVSLSDADGTRRLLSPDQLKDAEYLYTGFPSEQVMGLDVQVTPNARVVSFHDGLGLVSEEKGLHQFKADSLYGMGEQELADALEENSSVPVLYVERVNPVNKVTYPVILKAGSLDLTLDLVSRLAGEGALDAAYALCLILEKQFPDEADVISFLQTIRRCPYFIDYYAPFDPVQGEYMRPYGRIIRSSSSFSSPLSVLDQASHQELFFFDEQLMGDLYDKDDEELIGLPVFYSIVRGNKGGYQARTITSPMSVEDALVLAKRLKDKYRLPKNALDLYRLIVRETGHPDARRMEGSLAASVSPWPVLTLPAYTGNDTSRIEFLPGTCQLERKQDHRVESVVPVFPEVPRILFPSSLEEVPEPEPAGSALPDTPSPVPAVQVAEPVPEPVPEVEKTAETLVPDLPDIPDDEDPFSIERCPDGHTILAPNALAVYRYRSGWAYAMQDGVSKRYSFSLDDFLDDDLREKAADFQYSDAFFQEKVLCILDDVNDQASCLCMSGMVSELLKAAKDSLSIAYGMRHRPGDTEVMKELKRALGFTQVVLNQLPGHTLASMLRSEIHSVIQTLEDSCFKAPQGALRPTGVINKIYPDGNMSLTDSAYPRGIVLLAAHLVDRDYPKHRPGDELVYSIYTDNDGRVYPRFAHLARTVPELLRMADEWANEGNVENAWGIVMNILDADPSNEEARLRKSDYEQMVNADRTPCISLDCRSRRNATVQSDSFALAAAAMKAGKLRDAIHHFQAALVSAQDNEPGKKIACIQRIVELYSRLLHDLPDDRSLLDQYRQFGNDYLLISGKSTGSFRLIGTKAAHLETIIRFYQDMDDALNLARAYEQKRKVIANPPKDKRLPEDKYRVVAAEVMANVSWNYIRAGLQDDALLAMEDAISHDSSNGLAIQCRAVLSGRGMSRVDEKSLHAPLQPFSLEDLDLQGNPVVSEDERPSTNPVRERFRLLLLLQNRVKDYESLLARYLSTLLYPSSESAQQMRLLSSLPPDCQLIRQLYGCIQKGVEWEGWNDIRLACVFSHAVARSVCKGMYYLDKDFLRAWLLSFPSTAADGRQHQVWTISLCARHFQQWRKVQYDAYTHAVVRPRNIAGQLDKLSVQLKDISEAMQDSWMQDDDADLTARCRFLSDAVGDYLRAESSRRIHDTYNAVRSGAEKLLDRFKLYPTVLFYKACHGPLTRLLQVVDESFEARHFVDPVPRAMLVTSSDLHEDRTVLVELVIETQDNADCMDNCQLTMVPTPGVQYGGYDSIRTYSNRDKVYGGEPLFYLVRIRVGQQEVESGKASLKLSFSFDLAGKGRKEVPLEVDVPLTDDFEPFTNPFSNWGSREENPARFYGRDKDIKEVVEALSEPGVSPHFLYQGQKRSGKSSLLYHIRRNLDESRFLSADIDFLSFSNIRREEDVYYNFLLHFRNGLKSINRKLRKQYGPDGVLPLFPEPDSEQVDFVFFLKVFSDLKEFMEDSPVLKDYRIVLFIDEFTTAYEWLRAGAIDSSFVQHWKGLVGMKLFSAVLAGQDTMPAFVEATGNRNAFRVFEWRHLHYLPKEDAMRLVTEPIIEATGNPDVFLGDAVQRVLEYSASNAYYTKWICYELVRRMNLYQLKRISELDVEEAVRDGINNSTLKDCEDLFDALTTAGLQDGFPGLFSKEEAEAVLDVIANAQWKSPRLGCYKNYISIPGVDVAGLLNDLCRREVLVHQQNYYSIRVKLYLLWVRKKLFGSV